MRTFRTRKHVVMPAPRPFRVTKCTVGDREDLVQTLLLVDAALTVRNENDGVVAMSVVYDTLVAAEPSTLLVRDDLFAAATWGAAYHRLQRGECPDVPAASLRAEPGFIDGRLFNAIAWTGIEVGCRLEPRIAALGDYCVRVGHFVAQNGPAGLEALEAELDQWANDSSVALRDNTFRAFCDDQLVGEFWLDVEGAPRARSAMPLRPMRSIEKIYDDIIFDMAWDDLNAVLGRGRPRKTEALDWLAPLTWEPPLSSENIFFLPMPQDPHDKLGLNYMSGEYNGNGSSSAMEPLHPAEESFASVFAPEAAFSPEEPFAPELSFSPEEPFAPELSFSPEEPFAPEASFSPEEPFAPEASVPLVVIEPVKLAATGEPTIDLRRAEPKALPPLVLPPPRVIPAGWYSDPLQRFDHRWWDGAQWCEIVSAGGTPMHDPLRPSAATTF